MSTDSIDERQRRLLCDLYRDAIEPLAARRLLDSRVAPDCDPAASTYFRKRNAARLSPADFKLALGDSRQIAATLDAHWQGSPFAGLGSRIARISGAFSEVRQSAAVSEFVYEML